MYSNRSLTILTWPNDYSPAADNFPCRCISTGSLQLISSTLSIRLLTDVLLQCEQGYSSSHLYFFDLHLSQACAARGRFDLGGSSPAQAAVDRRGMIHRCDQYGLIQSNEANMEMRPKSWGSEEVGFSEPHKFRRISPHHALPVKLPVFLRVEKG
jgi:hypothetical protein